MPTPLECLEGAVLIFSKLGDRVGACRAQLDLVKLHWEAYRMGPAKVALVEAEKLGRDSKVKALVQKVNQLKQQYKL